MMVRPGMPLASAVGLCTASSPCGTYRHSRSASCIAFSPNRDMAIGVTFGCARNSSTRGGTGAWSIGTHDAMRGIFSAMPA